jgi:hypothetical protein
MGCLECLTRERRGEEGGGRILGARMPLIHSALDGDEPTPGRVVAGVHGPPAGQHRVLVREAKMSRLGTSRMFAIVNGRSIRKSRTVTFG